MQVILKALSWTFVHSLWQGLIAALIAAIIVAATRKATAAFRYNVLGLLLLIFIAGAIITFSMEYEIASSAFAATNNTFVTTNSMSFRPASIQVPVGLLNDWTVWFDKQYVFFMAGWIIFFLLHCAQLIHALSSVQRLRHYKVHSIPDEWKQKFLQLKNKLNLTQPVMLLQSELVKVPLALGVFKPVILLPLGLIAQLPADQMETILLHELAHIRRKDYLINLSQHIAESIFFFNPAVRWISSLLRQEREACCDDIVVKSSGQKRSYLDALVNFQEYSFRHPAYAVAVSSSKQYLLHRVKRMLTNENKRLTVSEKLSLLAGLLLFSAFTIISKEETVTQKYSAETVETVRMIPSSPKPDMPKPVQKSLTTENKKNIPVRKMITDSVPAKKDTTRIIVTEADKALQEIIKIKEEIGVKKESIGRNKDLIKNAAANEQEKILQKITTERNEIEDKRSILEEKRARYYELLKRDHQSISREFKQEKKAELKPEPTVELSVNDVKIVKKESIFSTNRKNIFHPAKKNIEKTKPQNPTAPGMKKTPTSAPVQI